jgi:hypothetical protein
LYRYAEVQHAAAAMHTPKAASAAERSDARLQHAEAEARRALIAQKIAANRAVYVQQKLISMVGLYNSNSADTLSLKAHPEFESACFPTLEL